MAAFDFPSSPSVNQTYTANGVTWKWNGTIWMRVSGAGYLEKIEEGDSKVEVDDSGSGNVTVTTDGTERLRIDSSGRVLIADAATTGPMETFGSAVLQVATTAGGTLVLGRNDTSVASSSGIGNIYFNANDSTGNAWNEVARISVDADGDHFNNDYPSRMEFYTTGDGEATPTERLRISSAGKVGIPAVAESSALLGINAASTSELSDSSGLYNQGNPCYLQIKNTTDSISDPECGIILQPRNSSNGSVAIYAKRTGTFTSDLIYRVRTGSSTSAERLRITHAGQIGIGTATPGDGTLVDVTQEFGRTRISKYGHIITQNHIHGTTNYWSIAPRNGGELDIAYGSPDSNGTVTDDKLTINTSGQMGLGTNDPNSYGGSVKLAVANTSGTCGLSIVSATNGDGNLYYADGTSGDATYRGFVRYNHSLDQFRFGTAGAERMRLHSGGTLSVPTGIEFGSGLDGTSANTLDDYEEGTLSWRLQRSDNIGAGNNVNTRVNYTKIGNRVYVSGYIYTQNTGSSTSGVYIVLRDNSNVSNAATLPYPPNHSGGFPVTGTRTISDNYRNMAVTFQENVSTVYLYKDDGDNNYVKNTNNVLVGSSQTHLVLQFCGSYTTNS